jgi:hypothetical protein
MKGNKNKTNRTQIPEKRRRKTMKVMANLLVLILSLFFITAKAEAEGYWKKQGQVEFKYGPDGKNAREWTGQAGAKVQLLDYSASHFTVKVSNNVGGGSQSTTYRTEFSTPDIMVPDKVVDVSSSATAIEMKSSNNQWYIGMDIADCLFGGTQFVLGTQGMEVKAVGVKVEGKRNLDARVGAGGGWIGSTKFMNGSITCGIVPTAWNGITAFIPYVWVDGTPPASTVKVPTATTPTSGKGVNLALNKPASQSSTSQWSTAKDAQGAVNGKIRGSYGFHTNNELNPWWQVDLGSMSAIDKVLIYNRLDCCSERAKTLRVLLSSDCSTWRQMYAHDGSIFGGKDEGPLSVNLNGQTARCVRLKLNEKNWFHLDQVEVYGTKK